MRSRAQFTSFVLGGLACAGLMLCGCQANVTPRSAEASDVGDPSDPADPGDPSLDELKLTVLANAGPDQTATTGAVVSLAGSATPPGGNTYAWTQLSGPAVTLSGANQALATFTAPIVSGESQVLTFRLTVQHGNQSGNDTMQVTVMAPPPVPPAGGGGGPLYPTVTFSCTPLDGVRDLSVTCAAATTDGSPLPSGTYAWTFDTQMESGPVTSHATRTHVFMTAGVHTVTLALTLVGLTAPVGCLSSQTNTPEGQVMVWPRILGQLTDPAGAGLGSVAVTANPGGYTGVSTSSGSYQIDVPHNWTGTVAPQSAAYSFSPASLALSNVVSDQSGQNFAGTLVSGGEGGVAGAGGEGPQEPPPPTGPVEIAGHISDLQGASVAGVTVTASGAGSTVTDASGNYTLTVAYEWSGTVTPTASAYYFTPPSISFTSLSSNQSGQNFTATVVVGPTIVGTVRHYDGTVWSGVPVLFAGSGASAGVNFQATSDANGLYQQTVPPSWSGTATSDPNYRFEPAPLSFTNLIAPLVGQDVTAFRNYYVDDDGPAQPGYDPAAPNGTINRPYTAIQTAANAAKPGDSVFLKPGTYGEHVHIGYGTGPDPAYSGLPGLPITYDSVTSSPYDVLLDGWLNGGYYFTNCIQLRADHVRLRNLTLARASAVACNVKNAHYIEISRCAFHGSQNAGLFLGGESIGAHDILVEDCIAYNNGNSGIFIAGSSSFAQDILVQRCIAWGNGWNTPAFAEGIVASWKPTSLYGHTERVTIRECVAFNNGMQIGLQDNIDSVIDRCVGWGGLSGGDGNGFKIGLQGYGLNCKLLRSVAFNTPARGVEVSNAPGAQVYNNTVFLCGLTTGTNRCGIDMDEGLYRNNAVFDNYVNNGYFSYDWRSSVSASQSDYNLWKDADGNIQGMPPGEGPHSLFGDPVIADRPAALAASGLFETAAGAFASGTSSLDELLEQRANLLAELSVYLRPAPGSPLIDAGTDLGLPFTGPAPDIGAFEAD